MSWIIGLGFLLAVAVPAGTYFLVRGKVRYAVAWALGALAVHLAAAWFLRLVLESVYAPRLMGEGGYVSLYRDGVISLNTYEELAALNQKAALACLALGVAAAAGYALLVRFLGGRETAFRARAGAPPAQLVGRECVACGKRLIVARDAVRCETCGAALHPGCREAHSCKPETAGEGQR
jgi:hypothetical protein